MSDPRVCGVRYVSAFLPAILQLDVPPFAERGLDPLIDCLIVAELTLRVAPQAVAFRMDGGRAEHQPFGVRPGDAEIRARRRSAFASVDPIMAMRAVVEIGRASCRERV